MVAGVGGVEPEKREPSATVHPMVASSGRYRQPPPWDFRNREADELVWVGAGPPAGRRAPGGDRSDRAHQVDQTLESDHPDRAAPGSPRKPALQFRCGAGAPFYAAAPCSRSRAWCTWWAPWRVQRPPVRVRCPVALSWSATFAHERPAARCSMIAASAVAVDPAARLWAWCRSMIRLVPVLLLMAAVVGGAGADPACLPDCNGENLIGRDLRFANMAGASLRGASLTIANAARADLSGADLSFANLARADLEEADLSEAELYGATLAEADLRGANLSGASLFGASLIYADLAGANLTGAELRSATLYGADLSGADLTDANLLYATLAEADLSGAILADANLDDAFYGTNLYGAILVEADLSGANLTNADLGGGTNLISCRLSPRQPERRLPESELT